MRNEIDTPVSYQELGKMMPRRRVRTARSRRRAKEGEAHRTRWYWEIVHKGSKSQEEGREKEKR